MDAMLVQQGLGKRYELLCFPVENYLLQYKMLDALCVSPTRIELMRFCEHTLGHSNYQRFDLSPDSNDILDNASHTRRNHNERSA